MGISSGVGDVGQVPVGVVNAFAGTTAPSGWLLCAGQAVDRVQYAGLFLTIGTTYGVGDGSTTFNVPDLRGRVVAGVDNMGGSAASRLTSTTITGGADAVGEVGGAQTHTLTSSESGSPSHSHSNTLSNSTVAAASHRHNFGISIMDNNYMATGQMAGLQGAGAYRYSTGTWGSAGLSGTASNLVNTGGTGGVSVTTGRFASWGDTDTSANTTVGINNVSSSASNASSAHNNIQPTMVLNYIIKAV